MKNKAKQLAQQQQNKVLNYKKRVIEKTNINRTHRKTETLNHTGNEKVNVEKNKSSTVSYNVPI